MAYIGSQPTKVVSQQSSRVYRYTATAGQTAFSGADVDNQVLNVTPSDVEVHMNGLLLDPTDYTATSSSVTLGTAANAGDELTVTGMVTFEVADTYNKATADARYVDVAGDTMTGALALPSGGFTVGTDQLAVDSSGYVTMADLPNGAWSQTLSTTPAVTILRNSGPVSSAAVSSVGQNGSVGRFTAPVTGLYHFNVTVSNGTRTTSNLLLCVFLNGALGGGSSNNPMPSDGEIIDLRTSSNEQDGYCYSHALYLTQNDYIEFGAYRASSSYVGTGITICSGYLIG